MTSPQATHLQVTQTPIQTVTPGQQIVVRSVTPVRPATPIKPVVTATDRPMQGVFFKIHVYTIVDGVPYKTGRHSICKLQVFYEAWLSVKKYKQPEKYLHVLYVKPLNKGFIIALLFSFHLAQKMGTSV